MENPTAFRGKPYPPSPGRKPTPAHPPRTPSDPGLPARAEIIGISLEPLEDEFLHHRFLCISTIRLPGTGPPAQPAWPGPGVGRWGQNLIEMVRGGAGLRPSTGSSPSPPGRRPQSSPREARGIDRSPRASRSITSPAHPPPNIKVLSSRRAAFSCKWSQARSPCAARDVPQQGLAS